MAIEIGIHPIDLLPDVALGVDIPMMVGSGAGFQMNYLSLDQAVANAKNLLITNWGERVMHPEFGCDLRRTLFEFSSDTVAAGLRKKINTQFSYWLPYIHISEIIVTPVPERHYITILLSISLMINKFDLKSIEINISTK